MTSGTLCVSDNRPLGFGFVQRIPCLEKSAQIGFFQKKALCYYVRDFVTYFWKHFCFESNTAVFMKLSLDYSAK